MLRYVCAGLAIAIAGCGAAMAAPLAPLHPGGGQDDIVLVAGGCGPGFHRGPYGGCSPNRGFGYGPRVVAPVRLPPPCPRGYYRDPRPGVPLCYPRF